MSKKNRDGMKLVGWTFDPATGELGAEVWQGPPGIDGTHMMELIDTGRKRSIHLGRVQKVVTRKKAKKQEAQP